MEAAVKCHHQQQTKVTVTKLGRLDGKIVIPSMGEIYRKEVLAPGRRAWGMALSLPSKKTGDKDETRKSH